MRHLAIVLAASLLSACAVEHVAYHSTEDIPYRTDLQNTQMQLVGGEVGQAVGSCCVVMVARDSNETPYVLLAPTRTGENEYRIRDADLARSVPLQRDHAEQLLSALTGAVEEWESREERHGTFSEFVHAPEQNLDQISENVTEWYPALRFIASHTAEGSTASLELGDSASQLVFSTVFREKEEIADLASLVRQAADEAASP